MEIALERILPAGEEGQVAVHSHAVGVLVHGQQRFHREAMASAEEDVHAESGFQHVTTVVLLEVGRRRVAVGTE